MNQTILSVDLEYDWESTNTKSITQVLPRLLDFFDEKDIKATFFVVGKLAEQFPKEIKEIAKRGHEVASHSYSHPYFNQLSSDEIEEEVRKSKQVFDKLNIKCDGFRAPCGIVPAELGKILKKNKFTYSSSIIGSWFPGRYNNISKAEPHRLESDLLELPIPNFSFFKLPSGLSYHRLFYPFTKPYFRKPKYMLYLHPHEFLEDKPEKDISFFVRTLNAINRGENAWKIFREFVEGSDTKFISCRDFIKINEILN